MKISVTLLIVFSFIGLFPGSGTILWSKIPQKERQALIAIFEYTSGPHYKWHDRDGWQDPPLYTDGYAMPGTENTWTGVTCDEGNTTVIGLDVHSNTLRGPIAPQVGDLSNLETLDMSSNYLITTIPKEIAKLSKLKKLILSFNQLTGAIPEEFGHLTELEELKISFNHLTGNIPGQLGNLTKLMIIDLSYNELTGPIPTRFENLENVEEIFLTSNQLTGNIPNGLGNLTKLEWFDLSSNQLTGPIPSLFGNLVKAESINLSSNRLSGTIPGQLKNLRQLSFLDLSSNLLEGPIPPALANLTYLEKLGLSSNRLTGNIPAALQNIESLEELSLASNRLSGPIPPGLENLRDLTRLQLSYNRLTGKIPVELTAIENLEVLELSHNRLTGTIPSWIGEFANLEILTLASNTFEGPIPAEITNLAALLDNNSDFRWNALYTGDDYLREFLNSKQTGGIWESTQTTAPTGVFARGASPTSVLVSWDPIVYTGDEGGYRVFYGETDGGPYPLAGGTTRAKNDSSLEVTGLKKGIPYYFVVRSYTEPHGNNQNTVESKNSVDVDSKVRGRDRVISGRVYQENGRGLEGTTITFEPSGRFVITNAEGYYEHSVVDGWAGTVTPQKAGYKFVPTVKEFEKVTADQTVDFEAKHIPLKIIGRVISGGEGLAGVTLTFVSPKGEREAVTGDDGRYELPVPYGWTGRLTPFKENILFLPPDKEYAVEIINNFENQDFQLKVSMSLQVTRKEDSAVLIQKDYGEIKLNVGFFDIPPGEVKDFIVYRKETGGTYIPVAEFPAGEPYSFEYIDKYLDKDKKYIYVGRALDTGGHIIGESKEKKI